MNSLYFSYDGITSESMGVYLVSLDSGMKEGHFLGEREIVSEQITGNDIPYRYAVINRPLKIRLVISPLEGLWTTEKRSQIARWLDNGKFSEFFSTDDINKRYFLMYSGGSNLYTNSNNQGYITIDFENISPYTYSAASMNIWELSTISVPTTQTFDNLGDRLLYPQEMRILKYGNGDFQIRNLSDGGRIFKFTDLLDQEEIHVQNQSRHISTSLSQTYRHDDFNGNYLRFVYGTNTLEITGAAEVKLVYRYEFKG